MTRLAATTVATATLIIYTLAPLVAVGIIARSVHKLANR